MTITEFRMQLVWEEGYREGLRQARKANNIRQRAWEKDIELIADVNVRLINGESAEKIAEDFPKVIWKVIKVAKAYEEGRLPKY